MKQLLLFVGLQYIYVLKQTNKPIIFFLFIRKTKTKKVKITYMDIKYNLKKYNTLNK